jgi:hypothetical protein
MAVISYYKKVEAVKNFFLNAVMFSSATFCLITFVKLDVTDIIFSLLSMGIYTAYKQCKEEFLKLPDNGIWNSASRVCYMRGTSF